jgi:hypothetical protein
MRWGPVLLVAVALVVLPQTTALAQITMSQRVVGSGGGESFGAGLRLIGTVGQSAIGVVTGPLTIHQIGFWYQPGWVLTEVPDDPGAARFFLGQCYPNPFNPVANIEFGVLEHSRVALKLYNVAGREVRTLADEEYEPGTYRAVLDGQGLPSGIYFCRMTAGEFTATSRLVLLK